MSATFQVPWVWNQFTGAIDDHDGNAVATPCGETEADKSTAAFNIMRAANDAQALRDLLSRSCTHLIEAVAYYEGERKTFDGYRRGKEIEEQLNECKAILFDIAAAGIDTGLRWDGKRGQEA